MSHLISQRVATVRRQLGWHRTVVAACRVAAVVLGMALVLGFLDYLVRYVDPGLRIMASAGLLAVLGWALWKFARPLVASRLNMLAVAQRIEQSFPHLQDRLSSSLVFLAQDESDRTAGSATLRRAVVNETAEAIDSLPLECVVNSRLTRQSAMLLASVLSLIALVTVIDMPSARTAATRLLLPLGSTEWPRTNQLEFRNVPTQIAVGDSFETELVDVNGHLPEEVVFHYRSNEIAGRNMKSEPMQRIGDVMVARREQVARPFEFRATGGDHHSMPWQHVEVVAAPKLESLTITAIPPAYTGLPSQTVEDWFTAIEGTQLEVAGVSSEPLQAARIRYSSGAIIETDIAKSQPETFRVPMGRWVASESAEYWIEVENRQGIVGRSQHRHLQVEPDPPPAVAWQHPQGDLFVLPQAIVPLVVSVQDNLQIQSIALALVRSDQPEQGEQTIPRFDGPKQPSNISQSSQGMGDSRIEQFNWDLQTLEIAAGEQLTVQGLATDYRPSEGRTPSPRHIVIITEAELQQRIASALENIARRLEQALAWERTAREKVRSLEVRSQSSARFENEQIDTLQSADLTQRRISSELVDQASGVVADIDALLGEVEMNRLDDIELREQLASALFQLNALAAGVLPRIESHLTTAIKSTSFKSTSTGVQQWQRVEPSLADARAGQDEAIAAMESLLAEFSQWTGLQRFAQELAQLHDRQQRLAEATRELTSEQLTQRATGKHQERREQIGQDQMELSRQFGKLRQLMQQASATIAKQHPAAAERLAMGIDKARELGTAAKLLEAQQQLQDNQLGRAARLQSNIGDDLGEIQESLRGDRKLSAEELARQQLDELRNMLATAIERQQDILNRTREVDKSRLKENDLSLEQSRLVQTLSAREREISETVRAFQAPLQDSLVIQKVLTRIVNRLSRSANFLADQATDDQVQSMEQQALAGLQRLAKSLEPEVPPESEPDGGAGQGGGEGKQPKAGSQYLLAELKLLRAMQADLVERTGRDSEWAEEDLAAEQGELAELVQAILSRNKKANIEPPNGGGKGLLERFEQWERTLPQNSTQ